MKTMKCSQLGGPKSCSQEFSAATFDEMADKSKNHGVEMFQKQDAEHLKAQEDMMILMKNPGAMQAWMEERRKDFNAAPEL